MSAQVAPAQGGSQPIVIEHFQLLSSEVTSLRDEVISMTKEGVAQDILAEPLATLESAVEAFRKASQALLNSAADRVIHTHNPQEGDIISCPDFAVGMRYCRDDTPKVRIVPKDSLAEQLKNPRYSDASDESRATAKFIVLPTSSIDGISARRLGPDNSDDGTGEVIFIAAEQLEAELQIRLHESVRLKGDA